MRSGGVAWTLRVLHRDPPHVTGVADAGADPHPRIEPTTMRAHSVPPVPSVGVPLGEGVG